MFDDFLRFGIDADDQREFITLPLDSLTHTHFKGMTGYGKSSLLAYLAAYLIHKGIGVALLDPAGDLAEQVLSILINTGYYDDYPDALERVVYVPFERGHREGRYIPFNVLSGNYDAHAAASVALESFKRIWPTLQDGYAINIDSLVHLGSYVLAEHKISLLPFLTRLYSDPQLYKALIPTLKDGYIKDQFETMKLEPIPLSDNAGKTKAKIPDIADTTIKRVNRLAVSPLVRYPLAQKTNLLDVEELLRTGRSVLLNLGVSDPYAKALIGSLFTQHLEQTSKVFRPFGRKRPYVLIIDEVEEFVFQSGQSLETMFAEARKAGVAVWVAHQYGAQLSDDLNTALSQCATKVTFRLDYEDALASVKQMGFPINPYLVKETIGNPLTPGGERAVYFSENEQWMMHALRVIELNEQEAYIQRKGHPITRLLTLPITRPPDQWRLEQLERAYIARYFHTTDEIEQEINSIASAFAPSQNTSASGTVEKPQTTPQHQSSKATPKAQRTSPSAVRETSAPPYTASDTSKKQDDGELLSQLLHEKPPLTTQNTEQSEEGRAVQPEEGDNLVYPEDADDF